MKSNFRLFGVVLVCVCGFAPSLSIAQSTDLPVPNASTDGVWRSVSARDATATELSVREHREVTIDRAALDALLRAAPLESQSRVASSPVVVSMPHFDVGFARFRVVEAPIMELALARRFPQLKTYLGQGIDDPTATLRFDVSPAGLHAQVLAADGSWYVDVQKEGGGERHVAYAKADALRSSDRSFTCEFEDDHFQEGQTLQFGPLGAQAPLVSSGETLRTFRLAAAATGEYTQSHGGTVVDGLAAIVTTMNRVNGIFERDLAVRMVLVANNDQLIYTNGATDPYTNSSGSAMLPENQTNITNLIGSANYDIGHVFSTGGGGVVSGRVCTSTTKARGVTGSGAPVGDAFDVDYVAHEMGHQFSAPHTYNSTSCSASQRSAGSAYESGSGSTVMAYAGICGPENLQPNSDDYFHRVSLNTIMGFVANSCGVQSATGNQAPTVSTPAAFTIPARTPFALTALGSDPDGDAITYLWEQFDLGASTSGGGVIVDDGSRPLFRPTDPVTDPTRIFPSLRYILNNANVPPAQAPLPGTTSPDRFTGEALATTSRTLNFRVTVRDNRAGGGGTNETSTALAVTADAGPFALTAPNTNTVQWLQGSQQTVTWDVANTNTAPVSTSQVRIALSIDGGYTFPYALAAATANDGSELITVPANIAGTQARVRVEAVGNIYFDISDANFTVVTATNTPPTLLATATISTRQGSPAQVANVATVTDVQDVAGSIAVGVSGAPPELAVSASNNAGTIALSATASCALVAPSSGNRVYPVLLRATDSNGGVSTTTVNINVGSNLAPALGAYPSREVGAGRSVTIAPAAPPTDPNSNLVPPTISPTTLPGGGTLAVNAEGVVTVTTVAGTTQGAYTVRVSARDTCGAEETREFVVTVRSSDFLFADSFE